MSALTRWSPFKSAARFDPVATIDDLFRGLSARALLRDIETAPDIRLDVTEDDKAYRIKADIPGVKKEDIEVAVDGNQVSISAEVKRESSTKGEEKEVFTEKYYGRVFRALSLPVDLDDGKTEARYDNGVLTLTLPKKQNGSARKIAVA